MGENQGEKTDGGLTKEQVVSHLFTVEIELHSPYHSHYTYF